MYIYRGIYRQDFQRFFFHGLCSIVVSVYNTRRALGQAPPGNLNFEWPGMECSRGYSSSEQ